MCTVCGCGQGETKIEGHDHGHPHDHEHAHPHDHTHEHSHADGSVHSHPHAHEHSHAHTGHDHAQEPLHDNNAPHYHEHRGELHYGLGPAHAHAPGLSQARMVQIEQNILGKNNAYAAENRQYFSEHGLFAINLVSSPGSGKTTLLVKTIEALAGSLSVAAPRRYRSTPARGATSTRTWSATRWSA